jgi:predicted dinucleotide-binding enzyme
MSRIVLPGGSGFLGQALAARLVARGDAVVILSRSDGQQVPAWLAGLGAPILGSGASLALTGYRVVPPVYWSTASPSPSPTSSPPFARPSMRAV